jgi:hypothetical protein
MVGGQEKDERTRSRFIITRPTGETVTGNVLTKAFAKARTTVDLPDTPTFHWLRHFYASVQIAADT